MSALDMQVGGDHYKGKSIQPVEYIHANDLDFFQGNIVKYITRWRSKGGIADLDKIIHYVELYKELELRKQAREAKPGEVVEMTREEIAARIAQKVGDRR
jgi:hypothetical protein